MINNNNGECMVEHHTHYKEIHGYDKTVWMTKSEHSKLHMKLRKSGKCNVPSNELRKISMAASSRTDKEKKYMKSYHKSDKCKKARTKYLQSNRGIKTVAAYNKSDNCKISKAAYAPKNIQSFIFYTTHGLNVREYEKIVYNNSIGTVCISVYFSATNSKKLLYIDIGSD